MLPAWIRQEKRLGIGDSEARTLSSELAVDLVYTQETLERAPKCKRGRIELTEESNLRKRVAAEYLADRPTLSFIGVEQRFGHGAAENTRQLPAKVHCVLDADVQALATHWRMDVGSIASEHNAALPVVLRESRFVGKACEPDRIARAKICPRDARRGGCKFNERYRLGGRHSHGSI